MCLKIAFQTFHLIYCSRRRVGRCQNVCTLFITYSKPKTNFLSTIFSVVVFGVLYLFLCCYCFFRLVAARFTPLFYIFYVFLSFIYQIPVYLQSSSGTPSFVAYKSNSLWVSYIRCCCCLLALHILLLAFIFAPSQSYNHDDIHGKTALAHFNEYEYVISKI